jgi:hypothetical protein
MVGIAEIAGLLTGGGGGGGQSQSTSVGQTSTQQQTSNQGIEIGTGGGGMDSILPIALVLIGGIALIMLLKK